MIVLALCLLLPVFCAVRRLNDPVARHICSPPASVRVLHYERKRDYLFFGLEPEYRIAFTATPQDLKFMVKKRGGVISSMRAWVSDRGGPSWFWPATRPTTGTLFMFHESDPAQYLWIDETGTNAFYLDWRI